MGPLLSLAYIALLLFWIRRSRFFALPGLRKRHLGALFLLKVLAGTALWWIYTYHYTDRSTADIYKYFDSSAAMYAALWSHPMDYFRMLFGIGNDSHYFNETYYQHINHWFRRYESNLANDSHTMIRFNAAVRVFSGGHFSVHTVAAAFCAFTGLTALCKALAPLLPGRERLLYASVFLLPSVLFWASGVIKESLLCFGLGLLLWKVFRWMERRFHWSDLLLVPALLLLLFYLKFYVLMSATPGLIALAWCRWKPGHALLKFSITLVVCITAALSIHHLVPGFNIIDVLYWKHRDFIGLAQLMDSGSFVMPPAMEATFTSFVMNAPHALYMTLLSPIAAFTKGPLGLVAAAETIGLLAVVIFFLVKGKRRGMDTPLLLFCVTFVIALSLVIGWTTPVIGAIVRYRVPLLPFIPIAALVICDPQKLPKPTWLNKILA